MKVTLRTIEGHRALTYTYSPMPGVTFRFHLLSEVGEPWQAEAQRLTWDMCYRTGSKIKSVELSAAPWYVDALVKDEPSPEQLKALEAFKRSHGRCWKEDLANAWWTGWDASQPNGHLLRQIRNQFGPQWLANYKEGSS